MATREGGRPPRAASCVSALALLALSVPALAAAASGPCDLPVTVSRPRLGAAAPRTIRIRIALPPPMRPRLAASAGRLSALRDAGDGWEADWDAPEPSVPRVAILAALTDDGTRCGFATVPLDGVGDAVVRTRPSASVRVRIGDRIFGPATADAEGVALVPVEVPPGVDAAMDGDRRIPLDVPPVAHTALLLARDAAPADAAVEVRGLLVATDASGGPLREPAPTVRATAGEIDPLEPAGRGAWRLRWRLPAGAAADASLAADLPGEPESRAAITRPAGRPTSARVTLDRAAVRAGEGPVTVTVALADTAGNAADRLVTAHADAGEVGPPEPIGPGAWRLRWTLPAALAGRTRAALSVEAGDASARAEVSLSPGAPARLSLAPAESWAVADGRAEVRLVAEVGDADGNPVDAAPTTAPAQAGELEPPRPAGPGRFTLVYRPRGANAYGAEDLTVELPPLSARARVLLRPRTPAALAASAGLAIGPGGWLGAQAGIEASAWRWWEGHEVGVSLAGAFTRLRADRSVATAAGAASFSGEVRTEALLLSASWRRAAGQRVTARLSAGAGAARVESLVSAGGGPTFSEAAWVGAVTAAAAFGVRLGPGEVFAEARGTWIGDPGLATLNGAPSPISLSLGYALDVR